MRTERHREETTMIVDLLAPLLGIAITAAAVVLMRVAIWDATRMRRLRTFGGGWPALQRDRIARTVPLPAGGALARHEHVLQGWQAVQRNRIARRRCARVSW
jgi:hypothetical protein